MKVTLLSLFAAGALAWPRNMDMITGPIQERALANAAEKLQADVEKRQLAPPQGVGFLPLAPPPFDAKAQYVSNQGEHAFKAPGSGDQRGPCPGLNAMANHGYIPRNGRASISQFIEGTNTVFGMARDLGGFLALYGALIDGDGQSWSIGGGIREGIGGSHNNYETDSSPIRADLNQYGSNSRFVMSQFNTLYNMQPATGANYNLQVLREFRGKRFAESVQKNPYFAYLPFGGIEVSQAAFTFIYRFMSNKSAENPEGVLSRNVLKSFMSVYGDDNNLRHVPGNERIPDNWYKRNPSDEYSVPYFEADILAFALTQPEILTVGCNKGVVNSYSPLDPAALTSGAYTLETALQNPLCFGLAFAVAEGPLITGRPASDFAPLLPASCKGVSNVNQSALAVCPGFSFYGGQTGPVAPGAIQTP